MAAVGWRPTVDNYLGRVTKGRILEAVSEAKGDMAAERIRSLKKAEMAKAAEELLIGTGWLPEPLRTPGQTFAPGIEPASIADAEVEAQSADNGGEWAMDETGSATKLPNRRLRPRQSRPNNTTSPTRARRNGGPFLLEAAMSESIADLARRLARDAEAVCRHYLSNGRRQRTLLDRGRSRQQYGPQPLCPAARPQHGKGAAGKWTDAATAEHGDLLDLIRGACRLGTTQEVLAEARRFLGQPRHDPPQHRAPAQTGSPEAARRLFALSVPIRGTVAESYLRRRGITYVQKLPALRFHPRCYLPCR